MSDIPPADGGVVTARAIGALAGSVDEARATLLDAEKALVREATMKRRLKNTIGIAAGAGLMFGAVAFVVTFAVVLPKVHQAREASRAAQASAVAAAAAQAQSARESCEKANDTRQGLLKMVDRIDELSAQAEQAHGQPRPADTDSFLAFLRSDFALRDCGT